MKWVHYNSNDGRGWEHTQPGWHQCCVQLNSADDATGLEQHHLKILTWLYQNIELCERHARWICNNQMFCAKFRYIRDHTWFALKWSSH